MKSLSILAAVTMLLAAAASPSFAVDPSISGYCDGAPEHATYARPGGYCAAVASNKSLAPEGGKWCPPGEVFDHGRCVCEPSV